MYITCELCSSANNHWKAETHDDYIEHLLSSTHQKNAMEKFAYAWENSSFQELFGIDDEERCIVVRGSYPMNDIQEQKILLESFCEFGLLHDFVLLRRDPKFICALIFDSKVDIRNIMLRFKKTKNGKEVAFTPWKSDDWVLLRSEIQIPELVLRNNSFPGISRARYSVEPIPINGGQRQNNMPSSPILIDDPYSHSAHNAILSNGDPMNYTFEEILESAKMPFQEVARRTCFLEELENIFRKGLPNCILNPLGSMVTQIGTAESPLDVNVSFHPRDFPEFNKFSAINKVLTILRLENSASQEKPLVNIKQKQENGVLLVKFVHGGIHLKCKIFINHMIALSTSQLLQFCLHFDPRCRLVALFIHHWANFYNLLNKCQISRYTLNLMIFVYLSSSQIIPSVFILQQLSGQRRESNFHRAKNVEWDISFCTDVNAIRRHMSKSGYDSPSERDLSVERILVLARNFFEFYLNADLNRNMVCSYLAQLFPKTALNGEHEDLLPEVLFRYKRWVSTVNVNIKRKTKLSAIGFLSVQDPFDHGTNVSKGASKDAIFILEEACKVGLLGINRFLSNRGMNNNLISIFSPQLQAKNQENPLSSRSLKPEVYLEKNMGTQFYNELNTIMCVAYPFLDRTNPGEFLELKPSKIFKQLFMQFFCTLTSQSILKKLRLYLWLNFAQDFLVDYLTSCFFFQTQEKVLSESELSRSEIPHSSNGFRFRNDNRKALNKERRFQNFHANRNTEESEYSNSGSEDESDESDEDSIYVVDDTESELQQDLTQLESYANVKNPHLQTKMSNLWDAYKTWGEMEIRRLYHSECTDPIWDNRESFRTRLKDAQPSDSSHVTHPLTMETMLSNVVQEANERHQRGIQRMRLYGAYSAFVSNQSGRSLNNTPVFMLLLKSNLDKFSQDNLNLLVHPIKKVFADYTKYRLIRWICD